MSLSCFAQFKPVLYGGIDCYRNTGFVSNAHGNGNIGVQLFKRHFLAPEFGFDYHFGSPDVREKLSPQDPNGRSPSRLETRFSSATISVAPKIIIGNKEASVVFLPQYNFGKINARGDFLRDTGKNYELDAQYPAAYFFFGRQHLTFLLLFQKSETDIQ